MWPNVDPNLNNVKTVLVSNITKRGVKHCKTSLSKINETPKYPPCQFKKLCRNYQHTGQKPNKSKWDDAGVIYKQKNNYHCDNWQKK